MEYFIDLIVVAGLFIAVIIFYRWDKEQKRKKRELEEKLAKEKEAGQKLCGFFKSNFDCIKKAADQFDKFLDIKRGYFSNYLLTVWKVNYSKLYEEIKDKSFENIYLGVQEVSTINSFLAFYNNADTLRTDFNKKFVKEELRNYSHFFDNINGVKLNSQQRMAIVTDEDNNIVIAGAGSGKTKTIIGKVNYIVDRYKTNLDEILLISFTNKSAKSVANSIDIEGVEVKTFHKFGIDVITEIERKQPSIFDEKQLRPSITKYFNGFIKNEFYLHEVTEYFTDFMKPVKSRFDFENQGDYIQYIRDQNFKTYKLKEYPIRGRTTYGREVVKSIEECKIANFLLFNGINYEYEYPYEHNTATPTYRQYKPDFTINQNGRKVYIEHLAVARTGSVPHFFTRDGETPEEAKERYWNKINWARKIHQHYGTSLVETFSYEMSEGTLFDNLSERLTDEGITLYPKSPEEIWKIINEAANDEVENFITLFKTFITLMKSNNHTIEDVIKKNNQTQDSFQNKRNKLFIEIIKPIYERYETHLAERNEIDFSDMINKASKYIANGELDRKFSYVLIDEFQDISIGRCQLVNAIKKCNPACKLFCVGDDWQSIYRFTGSDISLFKEFDKYFGYTVTSKLETTYRFHNPLIELSSNFILKNPTQAKKELKGAAPPQTTAYKIVYSVSGSQDDTIALKQVFDELIATKEDIENKKIYILGRYTFDINRIKNEGRIFSINKTTGKFTYNARTEEGKIKEITATFLTVHKAKGLEADIVIIINCNSGRYGFPSEMSDDLVLNLLLSEADQFEHGEERRLFYVATTRAKENVYFIADSSSKSKFIAELEVDTGDTTIKKCPRCKTANLVKKSGMANGRKWAFYGCSNYRYGCDYKEWIN